MYNKRNIKKNPRSPDAKIQPVCIFTVSEYFLPCKNNQFDIYSDCLSFLTLFLSSLNASYIPLPKVEKFAWLFICHLSRTDERHTDGQMVGLRGKTVTFYTLIESHAMEKLLFTFNK